MIVKQILKYKNSNEVLTIAPGATVGEAATLLAERRVGALVVSEDGSHAMGILSERDIVRALGERGEGCLGDEVRELMTSKLITCTPEEEAVTVLATMTEGRFRHLPVLLNGEMIGLISIGDVVKARLEELSMEKDALEGMIMGH